MKCSVALCILFAIRSVVSDVSTPHQCFPAPSEKCFTVIVDQKLNWNEAEKYCEVNLPNGRLASIHNAFEGSVIASWLPFLTSDPWIGAFQVGGLPFLWSDGSTLDYTNWAPGQPTGPCAQVCHSSATNAGIQCQQGKWRTADCETSTSQIICEYGNYSSAATTPSPPTVVQRYCNSNNGKCFALVTGSLEWTDAEQFCETQIQSGAVTSLASITNQSDQDAINSLLQHPSLKTNVWVGAYAFRSSPFTWSDQNPFSFTNWAPGQPPASPDGCVQVCQKTDNSNCVQGKWMVVPCKSEITVADCLQLHQLNNKLPSGIYLLSPLGTAPFYAYCDMETDGGGWTVFQRRLDGTTAFYNRTWKEYKEGFGNGLEYNFWLGLDRIHLLSTKDSSVTLRIEFSGNRCTNNLHPCAPIPCDGTNPRNGSWYGEWPGFQVEDESNWYRLHIEMTNAGSLLNITWDSMFNLYNNRTFATLDRNDGSTLDIDCTDRNCGQFGGWWYGGGNCGDCNLNEKYDPTPEGTGFSYFIANFPTQNPGLIVPVTSEIKLRRNS